MPIILPPGGEVSWPKNEGILGVVGVAPWATINFLKTFYAQIDAKKDWHYPRVIADINTKLPSRGRHLDLGESNPSPAIHQSILELESQGATIAVVPCNTAHILYDQWSAKISINVPNIIQETILAALKEEPKKIIILTSNTLSKSKFFEKEALKHKLSPILLDNYTQSLISKIISEIKQTANISLELSIKFDSFLEKAISENVDLIILGCTELLQLESMILKKGIKSIESNRALALRCIELINTSKPPLK